MMPVAAYNFVLPTVSCYEALLRQCRYRCVLIFIPPCILGKTRVKQVFLLDAIDNRLRARRAERRYRASLKFTGSGDWRIV